MGRVYGSLLVAGRGRTFLFAVARGPGLLGKGARTMVCLIAGDHRFRVANVGFASALVRPMDSRIVVRLPHGRAAGCAPAGLCEGFDPERRLGSPRFFPTFQTVDVVARCGMLSGAPTDLPVTAVEKLLFV